MPCSGTHPEDQTILSLFPLLNVALIFPGKNISTREGRDYISVCLWLGFPQGISCGSGPWVNFMMKALLTKQSCAWEDLRQTLTQTKGKTLGMLVTCLSPKHITSVVRGSFETTHRGFTSLVMSLFHYNSKLKSAFDISWGCISTAGRFFDSLCSVLWRACKARSETPMQRCI